jgi:spoIIIJ-associated protein
MAQNQAKKAKEITDEFLTALGVNASAKVFEVEEYLKIEIEGKDTSLLIGYHGDNLRSLKHLLSIVLRKNLAENTIITIDVGGYLAGKEERVKEMARKAAAKFEKTKRPQELPAMNSFERRIAHSELSELGYESESVGEGLNRHIIVKK